MDLLCIDFYGPSALFFNGVTASYSDFPVSGSRKEITIWLRNRGFTHHMLMNKNCAELIDVISASAGKIEGSQIVKKYIKQSVFKLYYDGRHVGESFADFLARFDKDHELEMEEVEVKVEMDESETEIFLNQKLNDTGAHQRTRSSQSRS